ncbi:hypothetical protein [Chlamydiifrater phoenicopteri]|uniref:hypothetical protein n=1 Tax=Chlamydiifrater phoenicopteri TaxID=2681469 RepID=UPI001BCC8FB1|nr:hypothetical protein [Chlamydiifrater phoenicopteri]
MELDRASFKSPVPSQHTFSVDNSHSLVKNTKSWQKAVVIIALSLLITGIVCLILSSTLTIAPAGLAALAIIGQRCFELGAYGLLVTGVSLAIYKVFSRQAKQRKELEQQPVLKRRVTLVPDGQETVNKEDVSPEVAKQVKKMLGED